MTYVLAEEFHTDAIVLLVLAVIILACWGWSKVKKLTR